MEKRKYIPVLRFPEFGGEWNEKSFGSLFSFKITNSFSRDQLNYEEGNVKNIHYGDIHTKFNTLFDITNEEVPFLNNSVSLERISDENYCKEGDVIFADASEDLNDVGKSIEVLKLDNQKVLSGLHTILARPNEKVFHDGFAGYLMKSNFVRTQIQREAQGTKVLSISSKRLSGIYIPYPAKPEQHKIASFFTAIDQKISHLKKKHQLLEQYKKGVMQKIFSQQIRFKDDDGRAFPKWEKKRLGDVYEITSSKRVFQNEWKNSGVPFFRAREVVILSEKGYVNNEIFISEEMYEKYMKKYGVPQSGDLLVTGVGTLGRLYVVKDYDKFYFKDGNIIWFKKSSFVNSIFVKYLFQTRIIKKQIEDNASITTVGTYTIDSAKKTQIPYPSILEQTKIANFLSAIDDKIHHTQRQIEGAEGWKKGLMQKMFV